MGGFQREANRAGIAVSDAVLFSIERNWVGFNADWYFNQCANNIGLPPINTRNKAEMLQQKNEEALLQFFQ